ncbi:TIGR03915 family putative DNA repair protein [Arenibacter sp. GZD96]|uniref:TIGR03915 family putative DNA repair protein n=1 Tax=Aurantibrevibacter litoralis TaxID=3106030 RepID=UPI002AFFCEF8|nr:TIGR03915 family putative DNA repair protein [Arenibacter sp. GZD-96]MEA1785279.1 TIGR03915 family putative DNA repair protein [Arenibacter sp. GZD-96]
MDTSTTLVYDGSFNGFLSCIYTAFERKNKLTSITKSDRGTQDLFGKEHYVATDIVLAKLVWNGISQKKPAAIKTIYFAFLSESEGVEMLIYAYIRHIMNVARPDEFVVLHQIELTLSQLEEKVAKEKRRMEAFVSFQLREDQVYVAEVKPKYNVVPLLSKHIKTLFKAKDWRIYDAKRNIGIACTQGQLEFTSGHEKMSEAV